MAKVAKGMIDPDDAVMLLIDHQSGLFQLVKDMDMLTLRNNMIAFAKAARLTKVPTFTTASVPDGPNGPLIPEIHEANPEAIYITHGSDKCLGRSKVGRSDRERRPQDAHHRRHAHQCLHGVSDASRSCCRL